MPVIRQFRFRSWWGAVSIAAALLLDSATVHGQEALRMSLASAQAAEMEKQSSGVDYYNLGLGPVKMRFEGELGVEYNDNVQYSAVNPQGDMILSPGINMAIFWPVTERNTLQFSTDVGYMDYLKNTTLSHLYVTPNSGLIFKMYVDDFVINFHDRFSVVEDVAQSPTVSGTGNFGQLENTVGVGADWDLYKLILSLGCDYDTLLSTTTNYEYIDHGSELFTLRAAFLLHDTTKVGLELGGGITTYDEPILNDNTDLSIGPFYEAQLSPHLSVKLSGGYISYMFAPTASTNAIGNTLDLGNVSAYYANLSLTHQVNRWLSQSLAASRQLQLGVTANLVDLYSVTYQADLTFLRNVDLTAQLLYQHAVTIDGPPQTLDVYGASVGLSYKITRKLTGGISYWLQTKKADPASYNYVQNRLVFDFKYRF